MKWFSSTPKKVNSLDLIKASLVNDVEKMKNLLSQSGIDLEVVDDYGRTALNCARRFEIIKLLVEAGANINAQNMYGDTSLIVESEGNFDIVNFLIDSGADLNIKNKNGETALFRAITFNDINIVNLLLKQPSIDINIQNNDGNTVLIYAVSQKGATFSNSGNPASNRKKIIELLLKSDIDWNLKNKYDNDFMFYVNNEKQLSKLYPDKYEIYIKNK